MGGFFIFLSPGREVGKFVHCLAGGFFFPLSIKNKASIFFLLLLHASFLCSDQRKIVEETNVLAPLFRSLCTYTETGYVLYGQKPVCVEGFSEDSCVFEPHEWHELSIAICVAKQVLKDDFFRSGEIILHIDDK